MQKKYTTVKIKVDKVTVADLKELSGGMLYGQVPNHASVEIKAEPGGYVMTFEWVDKSELDQKSRTKDYPKGKYNDWSPKVFNTVIDPRITGEY